MKERECESCKLPYTNKVNHVKQFHRNEAIDFFINRHISKGAKGGLCHICKIAFSEEEPRDHVAIKHKERAFNEFAKEKLE